MVTFAQRVLRRLKHTFRPEPKHRLILVQSGILPDGYFVGPNGQELYGSSFNPEWFGQLNVIPTVIVDVGSYDGGDAERFRRHCPEATIITIEADPDRADLVREALSGTSIEVVECAILDEERIAEFYRTSIEGVPSSQGSLFRFDQKSQQTLTHIRQSDAPLAVAGRTLSSLMAERQIASISLLHMDIQGGEYGALAGLGSLRPELIYLEVDAHYSGIRGSRHVHSKLDEMGYILAADFVSDRLYVRKDRAIAAAQ